MLQLSIIHHTSIKTFHMLNTIEIKLRASKHKNAIIKSKEFSGWMTSDSLSMIRSFCSLCSCFDFKYIYIYFIEICYIGKCGGNEGFGEHHPKFLKNVTNLVIANSVDATYCMIMNICSISSLFLVSSSHTKSFKYYR